MLRRTALVVAAAGLLLSAPVNAAEHELKATRETVSWGYFSKTLTPNLRIASGDEVTVEMVSHHSGDNPDLMITGDKALEEIFKWAPSGPGSTHPTAMRGMTGSGDGVHILTGPIHVEGAEPGDVLKVEILELYPRQNPQGETYGVNAAAWWGFHYGINGGAMVGKNNTSGKKTLLGLKTGDPERMMTTIYKSVMSEDGKTVFYGEPHSMSRFGRNNSVVLDCLSGGRVGPFKTGIMIPCVDGKQTWTGYYFPGLLTDTSKVIFDKSIQGKWRVPANLHVGCMGLAPSEVDFADSVPPMPYGGNVDDRRIGVGATMYYPIAVKGALLSMGDGHFAQGDGELDGTAIEMSITGRFKITVIKKDTDDKLKGLDYPLLENDNEYVCHGFSFQNYLTELGYADKTVEGNGVYGKSSVDRAVANAMRNGRTFLMNKGFSEDEAFTMMSVACDFGITQVVDGNWGAHVTIPKFVLKEAGVLSQSYTPLVITGTSKPTTTSAASYVHTSISLMVMALFGLYGNA